MSEQNDTCRRAESRAVVATCAAALVLLAACDRPRFEGAQLQDPPAGFLYKDGARSAHVAFPDREIVKTGAWTKGTGEPFSAIFITWYRGAATPDEVLAARDEQERRYQAQDYRFGPLEFMQFDGRDAWAWMVTHQDARGLRSREFRVAIPYDTMTYTVEFFTNKPSMKTNPDTLRWGVASFAVGVTTWDRRAVLIGSVVGGLFLLLVFKKLAADPFAANRNVRLVHIPLPDPDADKQPEPGADGTPGTGSLGDSTDTA